jgi:hypothetical protein
MPPGVRQLPWRECGSCLARERRFHLRRALDGHVVATAYELGWSTVTNGELIQLVEQEGYELLITTDTNLRFQQNLRQRSITILVLTTTS